MIKIYQIYYDEKTKKQLDKEFIPLENCQSEKKDWFEFWPILNYLRQNPVEKNTWYGFLSPRFKEKIGIDGKTVKEIIEENHVKADVFLASPEWDQISYFRNVFEQGEYYHNGLLSITKNFLDKNNLKIDLNHLVTDSSNSVFSNYIIAKGKYWEEWVNLAEKFYRYTVKEEEINKKNKGIFYNGYPVKVFIQERFPAIILAQKKFPTINLDLSKVGPINSILFEDNIQTRYLLIECDRLKKQYNKTNELKYLEEYKKIREQIRFKNPNL
jgi:hypothetical protein